MSGRPWVFSAHALERMRQMGLDHHEVASVLDAPEITYTSGQGRTLSRGGRLTVCHHEGVVITVLWRGRTFQREPA